MNQGKSNFFYVHVVIGLAMMFGFQFLPAFPEVTPLGMKVLGIFIGMIYLWTFTDTVWPSLLGLIALEVTGCSSIATIYTGSFGDKTAVLLLFSLMFFGVIGDAKIPDYMGQWFLTLKISKGRPLVFCFAFIFGAYILSAMAGNLASLMIFWPILQGLVEKIGYDRKDKFIPIMMFGVFFGAALGQPALPIKGGNLVVIAAFQKVSGMEVNSFAYIAFNLCISIALILMFVLLMKFVFRANLAPLKSIDPAYFEANKPEPMSTRQKTMVFILVAYLIIAIASGIMPKTWAITQFLKGMDASGIMICTLVIMCLLRIDGEPLFNIKQGSKHVNWSVYALILVVLYIATLLTSDDTGIKNLIVYVLGPILGGKGVFVFSALVLIIAVLLTNVANNAVIGAIMAPVIYAFSVEMGFNPVPVVVVMCMNVFFLAFLTPAASPYAALMHANTEWITSKDIYFYGSVTIVFGLLVCIVLGLPLANLLFTIFS